MNEQANPNTSRDVVDLGRVCRDWALLGSVAPAIILCSALLQALVLPLQSKSLSAMAAVISILGLFIARSILRFAVFAAAAALLLVSAMLPVYGFVSVAGGHERFTDFQLAMSPEPILYGALLFGLVCLLLVCIMIIVAYFRFHRDAYSEGVARIVRSALASERLPRRLYSRQSTWKLVPILAAPFCIGAAVILRLVAGPLVGPVPFPLKWLFALNRIAKRKSQMTIEEARQNDERAPVLILRSFADDGAAYVGRAMERQFESNPLLLFRPGIGEFRLEELIVRELSRIGPPIAIGAPGETLPALGAYRSQYADSEWQAAVVSWMQQARLIVFIGSTTRWLQWELMQVAERSLMSKVVVIFPPVDPEEQSLRLEAVSDALAMLPISGPIKALKGRDIIAIDFRYYPEITALSDAASSKSSYVVATRSVLT